MSDNVNQLEEQDRLFAEALTGALSGLDPDDDSAWNADGKVKMAAVEKAMSELGMVDATNKITRAEVERVYPEFSRQHQASMRVVHGVAEKEGPVADAPDGLDKLQDLLDGEGAFEHVYGDPAPITERLAGSMSGAFVLPDTLPADLVEELAAIGITPTDAKGGWEVSTLRIDGSEYDTALQRGALTMLAGDGDVVNVYAIDDNCMHVFQTQELFWDAYEAFVASNQRFALMQWEAASIMIDDKQGIVTKVYKDEDGDEAEAPVPSPSGDDSAAYAAESYTETNDWVIGVDAAKPGGDASATCIRSGTDVIAVLPVALPYADAQGLMMALQSVAGQDGALTVLENATTLFDSFPEELKLPDAFLVCARVFCLLERGYPAGFTRVSPELYDRAANSKLGFIDADIEGLDYATIVHRTPSLDIVKVLAYPKGFDPINFVPITSEQADAARDYATLSATPDNEGPEEDGHTYLPERFGYAKVNPKAGQMSKHLCDAPDDDKHEMYSAYIASLEQRVAVLEKLCGVKTN